MFNVQAIDITDLPEKFRTKSLYKVLKNNGGNVIYVEKETELGRYLGNKGFRFNRGSDRFPWDWLVIFR